MALLLELTPINKKLETIFEVDEEDDDVYTCELSSFMGLIPIPSLNEYPSIKLDLSYVLVEKVAYLEGTLEDLIKFSSHNDNKTLTNYCEQLMEKFNHGIAITMRVV